MAKKKEVKSIQMSKTSREKVAQMSGQLNLYVMAVKDSLNVPEDWVLTRDQMGNLTGFAPPKETK